MQSAAQGAALLLDSGLDGVVTSVERMQAQVKQMQHKLEELRGIALEVEAENLIANAEEVGELRLVTVTFENRPASELRALADKLRRESMVVVLLAGFDSVKLSLVAACASDAGLNARDLLQKHLSPFGGRGGGDAGLAQGGGPADEKTVKDIFANTKKHLTE